MGGAVAAIEISYMKQRLVESNARRLAAIEAGEQVVVGVNKFTDSAPSPLTAGGDGGILTVDAAAESEAIAAPEAWRAGREPTAADGRAAAAGSRCARRATTSWRPRSPAPMPASPPANGAPPCARSMANIARRPASRAPRESRRPATSAQVRARVDAVSAKLGRRIKILVGKPGLDGHSNGAEQIAVRARDAGHGSGL